MEDHREAWRHTFHACLTLARQMGPDDWRRPTGCPLWTVRDVYLHLLWAEHRMLGEEAGSGSGRSPTEIVVELDDVYRRRCADIDSALSVRGATIRAFDCWIHEQDIRLALGRPGNLGSPAAHLARRIFVNALPHVLPARLRAPRGTVIRFDVHGALPVNLEVVLDEAAGPVGSGVAAPPMVVVRTDWSTFVQLCAGRDRPGGPPVPVDGDAQLGALVLASMAITP